jgi:hypothetical protein
MVIILSSIIAVTIIAQYVAASQMPTCLKRPHPPRLAATTLSLYNARLSPAMPVTYHLYFKCHKFSLPCIFTLGLCHPFVLERVWSNDYWPLTLWLAWGLIEIIWFLYFMPLGYGISIWGYGSAAREPQFYWDRAAWATMGSIEIMSIALLFEMLGSISAFWYFDYVSLFYLARPRRMRRGHGRRAILFAATKKTPQRHDNFSVS